MISIKHMPLAPVSNLNVTVTLGVSLSLSKGGEYILEG